MYYRNQIEAYRAELDAYSTTTPAYEALQTRYDDLRADAARVNQELLCFRYLVNELETTDAIVDECAWEYGIHVMKL